MRRLSFFQPQDGRDLLYLKVRSMLEGRIPGSALDSIAHSCSDEHLRLKITRGRATKTGDFRPPKQGRVCSITINGNLNPYSCLITLVHELAHFRVHLSQTREMNPFRKYGRRVAPHGKEWKATFRALMFEYLTEEIFPAPVLDALMSYMENPTASTFANQRLVRALAAYDAHTGLVTVESLPEHAVFSLTTGRRFRKLERKRIRYLCVSLDNNRKYLFSPIAQVLPEDSL